MFPVFCHRLAGHITICPPQIFMFFMFIPLRARPVGEFIEIRHKKFSPTYILSTIVHAASRYVHVPRYINSSNLVAAYRLPVNVPTYLLALLILGPHFTPPQFSLLKICCS